jgi:hypothetical protein
MSVCPRRAMWKRRDSEYNLISAGRRTVSFWDRAVSTSHRFYSGHMVIFRMECAVRMKPQCCADFSTALTPIAAGGEKKRAESPLAFRP